MALRNPKRRLVIESGLGGSWVAQAVLTSYGISYQNPGKLGPSEGPIEAAGIGGRSAAETLLCGSSVKVASTARAQFGLT